MEGVFEAKDRRALGVCPGYLDGILHPFRATIDQKRFLLSVYRGQSVQSLRHIDVCLVGICVKTGVGEHARLILDRRYHLGRGMTDVEHADPAAAQLLADNVELLKSLAMLDEVSIAPKLETVPATAAAVTAGGVKLYVLGIIDPEAERSRLARQSETLQRGITGIERKLSSEGFLKKAPSEVVEGERERLGRLKRDLDAITRSLEALG